MAVVNLQDVKKRYGQFNAIRGVDLEIADQEFVVFLGPSGCGKSTLLRMIAGLEEINEGTISVDGTVVNDTPAARRGLAMVFQSYALYPHMTVANNMGFSLKLAGVPEAQRMEKVREVAAILKLEPLLDRKPRELSGGQRQRVAIGRAIVREPKVFLFDEPLSNLDASLRVEMRLEIARLHQRLGATMIYVTHDQVEAMTLADKIVVMRDGLVEQVGQPLEIYHHPISLFVAEFIGSPKMNTMPVEAVDIASDGITVRLPQNATVTVPVHTAGAKAGQTLTLGIRPEHLRVDPEGPLTAKVSVVERLGDETYLHLDTPEGRQLVIQSDGEDETEAGQTVRLTINGRFCHLFDDDGRALTPLERHRLADSTKTGRKVR